MLINFPNHLTSEEEQLLKKIAKMKKKVARIFSARIYGCFSQDIYPIT